MTDTGVSPFRHGGAVLTPINGGRPFSRASAGALGLTPYQLTRGVATGRLRRPLREVYVDAATRDDRDQRIACLALVLPDHAVVWGRSAA